MKKSQNKLTVLILLAILTTKISTKGKASGSQPKTNNTNNTKNEPKPKLKQSWADTHGSFMKKKRRILNEDERLMRVLGQVGVRVLGGSSRVLRGFGTL